MCLNLSHTCSDAYRGITVFAINILSLVCRLAPLFLLNLSSSVWWVFLVLFFWKSERIQWYLWFRVSADNNLHCTRITVTQHGINFIKSHILYWCFINFNNFISTPTEIYIYKKKKDVNKTDVLFSSQPCLIHVKICKKQIPRGWPLIWSQINHHVSLFPLHKMELEWAGCRVFFNLWPCCMQFMNFMLSYACFVSEIFLLYAAQLQFPPTSSFLPIQLTLHFSYFYGLLVFC